CVVLPRRGRETVAPPAARAIGLDAAALRQASFVRIHAVWLRHGAPDWESAFGGLEITWKTSAASFPSFSVPRNGLPNLLGSARGHATGIATHEACFEAAATMAQVRVARSRQFPRFGAVAP
ncbi:MAG: hypothetical protein IKO40_01230, partial [Kiritimatiellae bacterium]|nr:hypothetical protein [Kiritimatiellia bacterium]